MNHLPTFAFLALCAVTVPSLAADSPAKDGSGTAADVVTFDQQMKQMQEHMQTMQEQMDKIQKTTDSAERQKLMQQHMASMREAMMTMHNMMGPSGMNCCMMGGGPGTRGSMMGPGGMMDGHKPMSPEQMQHRHRMMEQMMGMQQMMMNQMLQHQQFQERR